MFRIKGLQQRVVFFFLVPPAVIMIGIGTTVLVYASENMFKECRKATFLKLTPTAHSRDMSQRPKNPSVEMHHEAAEEMQGSGWRKTYEFYIVDSGGHIRDRTTSGHEKVELDNGPMKLTPSVVIKGTWLGLPAKISPVANVTAEKTMKLSEPPSTNTQSVPRVSEAVPMQSPEPSKPVTKLTWDPPNKLDMDWYERKAREFGFNGLERSRALSKERFKDIMDAIGRDWTRVRNDFPGVEIIQANRDKEPNPHFPRKLFIYAGENLPGDVYDGAARCCYDCGSIHIAAGLLDFFRIEQYRLGNEFAYTSCGLGTTRHEFGHMVHDFLPKELSEEWDSVYESVGGELTESKGRMSSESPVSVSISKYATVNQKEGFAEAFSVFTDPNYGRGEDKRLPNAVESFFEKILK
ncbi:MAG TPA: hypothetical protein PLM79_09645 [Syntrophobacteraceae bacterium]|nr:hypothetical protein [Syntrophobacteraceae bacterium]